MMQNDQSAAVGAAGEAMTLAVPSTPRGTTRKAGAQATGSTPAAKRPVNLDETMQVAGQGQVGPPMDASAILAFVYRIHHEVEGLKHCGRSVNECTEDHA